MPINTKYPKINTNIVQWMAVYTKPRNEKKVAERLELRGYEVYCPLQTTMRQWSDRKKKVKIPVIPSYVFLKISEKDRYAILQDPGVLNFVYWLRKPAIISEKEINLLKQFLDEYSDIEINKIEFKSGDKVIIKAGPLKDEKGEILEIRNNYAILTLHSVNMQLKAKLKLDKMELDKQVQGLKYS